jgi:hypothetical protein
VDPGGERHRGVWTSERVYRALMRLYPEEVRRRYAEEMVRYFGDLCREEWHSRGAKGMVLLWARTLPDLVFTVLKERVLKERGWLLAALSVLLMCGGAYAARDALLQPVRGKPPGAPMGPLSDESQKLGPQKTVGGARVTLKWAYAEEKKVVVGVKVEDLEGDRSIAGYPAELQSGPHDEGATEEGYGFRLTDESDTEFRLPTLGSVEKIGAMDAPEYYTAGFNAEEGLEPAKKHRFHLEVSLVEAVLPWREFWWSNGEERPPPEPVGKPFVFDFQIPVRGVSVVKVGKKETASSVTLTLDRVIDSPGRPQAVFCYEAPDDEHSWMLHGGKGTYLGGWGMSASIQGVPPAKCQTLKLKGPLEGRTLVEVRSLQSMPVCRAVKPEDYEACDEKIGDRMIRGPWRFEFEVPDSAGGARPAREAESGGGGA